MGTATGTKAGSVRPGRAGRAGLAGSAIIAATVAAMACSPVGPSAAQPAVDSGVPGVDVGGSSTDGSSVETAIDVASDGNSVVEVKDATAPDGVDDAPPAAGMRRQQICARWTADRLDRAEGAFTGDVAQCMPGDTAAPGRTNALKMLNLFRFIADLDPVTDDPAQNTRSQACAIMMDANNALSHMPPTTWKCYTPVGATAAGASNISPTPGVAAIDLYMNDPGNETTLGHRRWLLSNSLGPVGLGSTMKSSCLLALEGKGRAAKLWRAWPAPGPFPFDALKTRTSNQTLDSAGWSIQSDTIDLTGATVAVTDGGQDLPVTTTQLGAGYGSRFAIRWVANGWTSTVEHTYHVQISGVTPAIEYDVQMVACP